MTLSKLPANRQVTLVKGHMAMIMLFSRNQIPTGSYIAKLLEQLGAIEHDRVCLPTSKILADGFVDIFESYTSFGLGQQLLIGEHYDYCDSDYWSKNQIFCTFRSMASQIPVGQPVLGAPAHSSLHQCDNRENIIHSLQLDARRNKPCERYAEADLPSVRSVRCANICEI